MKKVIVYDSDIEIYNMLKKSLCEINAELLFMPHFNELISISNYKRCNAVVFNLDKIPEGGLSNIEVLHLIKRIVPGLLIIAITESRHYDIYYSPFQDNCIIIKKQADSLKFKNDIFNVIIKSIMSETGQPEAHYEII